MVRHVGQRVGGKSQILQPGQRLADPDPVKPWVVVRRVLDPRGVKPAQMVAQCVAAQAKHRAQPQDTALLPMPGHGRQPVNPCPTCQPHHKGFRHIIARVTQRHRGNPGRVRPIGHQCPPPASRRIHQIALAVPMPMHHLMRDTQRVTNPGHKFCLGHRPGPQTVIHRHHPHRQPGAHGKVQQRHAVAPARHGQAQTELRWIDPCGIGAGQKGRGGRQAPGCQPQAQAFDKPRRNSGQVQPSPCIAALARASSSLAGKRLPTSAKVTQASGVWPSLPSD